MYQHQAPVVRFAQSNGLVICGMTSPFLYLDTDKFLCIQVWEPILIVLYTLPSTSEIKLSLFITEPTAVNTTLLPLQIDVSLFTTPLKLALANT